MLSPMEYCGRQFTSREIDLIHDLIEKGTNRTGLSRMFCEKVEWRKPDGGLKEMSCRVALLRMEKDGLILLPAPQRPANNHLKKPKAMLFSLPLPDIRDIDALDIETDEQENECPLERVHRAISLPRLHTPAGSAAPVPHKIAG